MPPQYKILISILALIVTAAIFIFDTKSGVGAGSWVALLLGPLMVIAIWIFPEPKSKDIRNEAAKRR